MKYTFKTVPTNYIVWQTRLIPNIFECRYPIYAKKFMFKKKKILITYCQLSLFVHIKFTTNN